MMNQQRFQHSQQQAAQQQNQPAPQNKPQNHRSQERQLLLPKEFYNPHAQDKSSQDGSKQERFRSKPDDSQQRGFNSDNFQIESSQDNCMLSEGDDRRGLNQMMMSDQLEKSAGVNATKQVRAIASAHPDLHRQYSELQHKLSKTPHPLQGHKSTLLHKFSNNQEQAPLPSSELRQEQQHSSTTSKQQQMQQQRHQHNLSAQSQQMQSKPTSSLSAQYQKFQGLSKFEAKANPNQQQPLNQIDDQGRLEQMEASVVMRASSDNFQFGHGAFPSRSNTQHVAHDSNFDFQLITHQDVMNAFNPLAQSIENLQFQSNLNDQLRSSSSGLFLSNNRMQEETRGLELHRLVSGEGTLKTSQNFGSLNRELPQTIQSIRHDSVELKHFNNSSSNKNIEERRQQTRNQSSSKSKNLPHNPVTQSSELFSPLNASSSNLQANRNLSKPPTANMHFQMSQTQGIKRIERVHKESHLVQSMSSGLALKAAASQHQLIAQEEPSSLKGQAALVHRNRCESVGLSKSGVNLKDRNCKTSSPKPILEESKHHNHHQSIGGVTYQAGAESKMRKRSKEFEVQKREKFADLIVILGIKYDEFIDQERVKPQVVGGYPDLSDKEFIKNHLYIDNLIWVCFPEGFSIQPFEKKRDGELCQMKIFHFIITQTDGDKKYMTYILFKELFLSEKKGAFIVPKSICVVSSKPLFTLQKQLLSLIFQKVILGINALSIKAFSQGDKTSYLSFITENTQLQLLTNEDARGGPSRQGEASHSAAVDQYLMRRIEFYLSLFFNHLYYSEEVDQDIEIEEIRERKLPGSFHGQRQCPPNCGKKKHRHKEKVVDSYFRFRNTKRYGFTLENYSFELLLQSLKPERILFLMTALLLERKIILIKENFGDTALIMESLVSLLNPLKWNYIFITYLTPKLVECLEAPFPYIIGVSRKVWEDWCVMREYPDEIIIFDIDNQKLVNQVREELPLLPQPQASVLQRSLKDMLDIKERFIETIQENATKKVSKDKMEEYYWAYAQIRVKQSFFNFFLLTINNYIGYFKNLDEEGNLSPQKKDKQFYDKLSSNDVFDFDNYLNQFEGYNKEFMHKFVRTQSFNNFIEETYKNTTSQNEIGFFKTNLEVMIDYSFKKLKKEQNKLLDKTFFNLQNPVKFNIGHMFRQYRKQVIIKNEAKIKAILEMEMQGLTELEKTHVNRDIFSRPDLLQKLLLQDIDSKSSKQISLMNGFEYDFVTQMPGIQYDQISTYEQIKSQRSDQSQERRFQNRTVVHGNSQIQAFDSMNQNSLSLSRAEGFGFGLPCSLAERSVSLIKSRNQNGKIVTSRSGDLVTKSFTSKNASGAGGLLGHKRSQGGMIYENFLSMAANNPMHMSHHEENFKELLNSQKTVVLTKDQKGAPLVKERKTSKGRIHSDIAMTAHHQPSFSLNKTIDLKNPSLLGMRQQASTVTQKNFMGSKKSSTTRNNALHQSQILSSLNNTQGAIMKQGVLSPKLNLNGSTQDMDNTLNLSLKRNVEGSKTFYKERQLNQQTVLKEALTRQIQKERQKQGLNIDQDQSTLSPTKQPISKLKNQSSLSHLEERGITTQKNSAVKRDVNQNQSQRRLLLPSHPSKIDLMNPRQKKISRNEERKLAMKKGFMNPQQHESFHQFLYSPNEELDKLAMMQVIKRKVESGQIRLGKNKDQMSFSNLLYTGINDGFNASSLSMTKEQDIMTRLNQITQANNQIQFQRRMLQEPELFQANELFLTTIKNQNNWIQQKSKMPQSPSVTNTELSSVRKGHRRHQQHDQQQHHQNYFSQEEEELKIQSQQFSPLADSKPIKHFDPSDSITQQPDELELELAATGDENLDSMETRPLKVVQEDMSNTVTRSHVANSKHQPHNLKGSLHAQSDSFVGTKNKQLDKDRLRLHNLPSHSQNPNSEPTVRKDFKPVNPNNKSPLLQTQKYSKNPKDQSLNGIPSNFEQASNIKHDVLSRKRSQQVLGQEQSKHQKVLQKTRSGEGQTSDKQSLQYQQQQQYFKKRPLQQNLKSSKHSHVVTTTVDLISKPKFAEQAPSRMDISKDMSSLRISPIPNLSEVLNAQRISKHSQSANLQDFNQTSNEDPSNKDASFPNKNSSSGVSDEPLLQIQGRSSSNNFGQSQISKTNRIGQKQTEYMNPLSSNYQSRQSEKSINLNYKSSNLMHKEGRGLSGSQIEGDLMMFSSMSHLLEQDLFDKGHATLNGLQTVRNDSFSKTKFATSKFNKQSSHQSAANHYALSMSQRSSSNQQLNFHLRASNISGGEVQINRPSNTSSINDLFKFRKEKSNQKLVENGNSQNYFNNSSSRHSDILSQYEPQNKISVSVLKSSPRMNMAQTFSRTTKHEDSKLYDQELSASQLQPGKRGGLFVQGAVSKIETAQPSVLTSNDSQSMKFLLNALKQNIPQTEAASKNSSHPVKSNLKSSIQMNQSSSTHFSSSAAQKSAKAAHQKADYNGQSVNVVNIDLNKARQMIVSPKGLSGSKKQDALLQSSAANKSAKQAAERNSSIEEVKRNINMFVEAKALQQQKKAKLEQSQRLLQLSSHSNFLNASASSRKIPHLSSSHIGIAQKKHVRSPQPQMEASQSLSSKMKALTSMHSQEFNLKEKSKHSLRQDKNIISNFSSDQVADLSKDQSKSTKKKKDLHKQMMIQKSAQANYSSTKNLKDAYSDRSHVRELNFKQFLVEPSASHNFNSDLVSRTSLQNQQMPSHEYESSQNKDRIILQPFEELRQYRSTKHLSGKMKEAERRVTSLILEEPLIDSQGQSPDSHQSSPVENEPDTPHDDFQNSSNFDSNPQAKLGVHNFQTLNAQASSKIGESFVARNENIISERDLETVRNHELQFKHFNRETRAHAFAAKESMVQRQAKYRESTHELDLENQEIEMPRPPMVEDYFAENLPGFDQGKPQLARHGSVEAVERVSKINKEVDELINEMSQLRKLGEGGKQQKGANKSKVHIQQQKSRIEKNQQSVDMMRDSIESKYSFRMRVQSQYQDSTKLQPLNEIKQVFNRQENSKPQQRMGHKLQGMRKSEHVSGSHKSENSLSQFEGSSKNSNSQDQHPVLPDNGYSRTGGQKRNKRRSQYRHGMTTCFGQQQAKESYIKKDLNMDAFCKINSHIGDIDNDPHTPKSDQYV